MASRVMSLSWRSGIRVSVKSAPVRFIANQGRIDQVDHFGVPITNSIASNSTHVPQCPIGETTFPTSISDNDKIFSEETLS